MIRDINNNVEKVFKSLEDIQSKAKVKFSVYGPVVPFLLLSTLQTAINRQVGNPEHSSELLNISKGLYKAVPILNQKDTETIIDCVSEEVGDSSSSLKNLFNTSISAFNSISINARELTTRLEGFSGLDYEHDAKEIFEAAIIQATKTIYGSRIVTNPSIALLAKSILQVEPGETFSDFVCGTGFSSSLIAGDIPDVKMILSDIEIDSYAFACIGCFLRGSKNYGKNEDSLSEKYFYESLKADKIFIDPPLRARMGSSFEVNGIRIKESSCSAIMKAVDQLKEYGKAVIAINTGFTYGSQFEMADIRKYLVDNGLVSAIISLPAMWSAAGVLTTLLVLSKTDNKEIRIIDFAKKNSDSALFGYSRTFQANILTDEGVRTIVSMLTEKVEQSGICANVSYDKVIAKGYLLLPSIYLEDNAKKKLSVDEIDGKIEVTISEIEALIAKL